MTNEQIALRLLPMFASAGFTWWGRDTPPSYDDILGMVQHLMAKIESGSTDVGCGRICIKRDEDGDIDVYLNVATIWADD